MGVRSLALVALATLGCQPEIEVVTHGCTGLCSAFVSIRGEPESFVLTLPPELELPPGHDGRGYHLQGAQRLPDGGWVVSGSAPGAGYLALADERGSVRQIEILHSDFDHPGGFQVTGSVLAIGSERTGARDGGSRIDLYEVGEGAAAPPRYLAHLTIERETETAGESALARIGGSHQVLVGGWDAECLELFGIRGALLDPRSRPESIARWCASRAGLADDSVDRHWPAYQNLNLFEDSDGGIALVGTAGTLMTDRADFYEVLLTGGSLSLRKLATRTFPTARGVGLGGAAGALLPTPSALEIVACARNFDERGELACQRWR